MPPFQIKRESAANTTFGLSIYNSNDFLVDTLGSKIENSDKVFDTVGTFDYITYLGNQAFKNSYEIGCGTYYLKYSDGNNDYYSELFQVAGDDAKVLVVPAQFQNLSGINF